MPLKYYKHKESGEIKKSLKTLDSQVWEELIIAPHSKFMVCANELTGKSKLKDADAILKERARNHSRDINGDENIQFNRNNGLQENVARNLLNEKGEKRRKIDDI